MKFVLGIDIGTTHCKAVALATDGTVLHENRADYPTIQAQPGQSEQDAEMIFAELIQVLQQAITSLGAHNNNAEHQLTAVCFSSAMHSLLAVDAAGKPLTNAFTWADTRSNEYALHLRSQPYAELLYERTGTPVHPMSPLCKLLWLRDSMPQVFNNAAKFISIKEYIFYRLFGKYVIDHSIASATGLFDIYSLQWSAKALEVAGVKAERLSQPVPVTHAETELRQEYRRLLGIHSSIPFIVGASDGCLANIGSGAINPGEAALTIGTSGAVRVVVEKPVADPQQRLFNYILADGLFITGGAVSNGGAALKWFAENFLQLQLSTASEIDWLLGLAQQAPAGAGGLIFLPYLSGERAPFWDAQARGVFIGLQTAHRKEHLVRAVLEGISFALCQVLQAVEETNGQIETVYASGSFVRSHFWLQVVADMLNKNLVISGTADASAVGAALLALQVIGTLKSWSAVKQIVPEGSSFYPDAAMHETYKKYFEIYAGLYPKLKTDFRQLQQLQQ
jgi:gluconokinase